jgi:hypothetical protein
LKLELNVPHADLFKLAGHLRPLFRRAARSFKQFLLDINALSDLVRHPRGRIFDRVKEVGEQNICTSIVVAAELRYSAPRKTLCG